MQRIEIGKIPDGREYQAVKGLPATMRFDEILRDKGFTYNPPELAVEVTPVKMDGARLPKFTDFYATYDSIVLSNVPRRKDRPFPPHPSGRRILHLIVL